MREQETAGRLVLADAFGANDGAALWLKRLLLVAAGVALLTVSAKIKIILEPVNVTMQVFAVMVVGAAYGSRLGLATVIAYLALGAAGAPVFTGTPEKGIGVAYMMGPTGGYLLGFALAAYLVGWLAERGWDRNWLSMALAMIIGLVVLYIPGVIYIAYLFGAENWYAYGVKTFIWIDAMKLALAVLIFPGVWALIGRARG